MSALTELFQGLANKIRSKTGSESTLTLYDMIDAIDDVYAKGKADGLPATFSIALNTPNGTKQNGIVVLPKELLSGYTTFTATLSNNASVQFGYITNYSYLYPGTTMTSGSDYTISWGTSDLGLAFKFATSITGVTYIEFS